VAPVDLARARPCVAAGGLAKKKRTHTLGSPEARFMRGGTHLIDFAPAKLGSRRFFGLDFLDYEAFSRTRFRLTDPDPGADAASIIPSSQGGTRRGAFRVWNCKTDGRDRQHFFFAGACLITWTEKNPPCSPEKRKSLNLSRIPGPKPDFLAEGLSRQDLLTR